MSYQKLIANGRKTMSQEMINLENEIAMEIEELEDKLAPQSSSSFLD
jgi:hypothetical protein